MTKFLSFVLSIYNYFCDSLLNFLFVFAFDLAIDLIFEHSADPYRTTTIMVKKLLKILFLKIFRNAKSWSFKLNYEYKKNNNFQ